MGWQRWNLFLLLLDRAKLSVLILRKGNKPSMTFTISDTREAAQLLTHDYQSKIVHHGNVELRRKVTVKHLICSGEVVYRGKGESKGIS